MVLFVRVLVRASLNAYANGVSSSIWMRQEVPHVQAESGGGGGGGVSYCLWLLVHVCIFHAGMV
jgi:hypothetical protein